MTDLKQNEDLNNLDLLDFTAPFDPVKKGKVKKTTNINDVFEKHKTMINFVQNIINNIELDLKRAKLALNQLSKFDPRKPESINEIQSEFNEATGMNNNSTYTEDNVEVVEGTFDGYFMIGGDQKKYPVPMNYSSKTKLVPGDSLKLKILDDGKFVYKLTNPVPRKHIRAVLSKSDENKFVAITDDGKSYFLNQAAVTFFKGKPGDELYIVVNSEGIGSFGAIEAIIKK